MTGPSPRRPRPSRDERQVRRDLVLSVLAVVSVGIGAYELAVPEEAARFTALNVVDLAIVGVFIVDFAVHARRSGDAWRYARRHWWELPALIPVTGGLFEGSAGFSVLRGLRLVRVARVFRLLRVIGAATRSRRALRYAWRVAERAQLAKIVVLGVLLVLAGALLGLLAETHANPRLRTMGDAVWWSLNIFTTVSYLDFQPATRAGRIVAGALAVLGVGYIGVLTASLANAILREPGPDEEPDGPPVEEPPLD